MERPGLKQLLEDVAAGKAQVVVVYKVDRLTRALADFAKIIETFDANGASFVSVTQQFNTTTSMGTLTLNVLLSFAQFEREVTGERIRDKIAASKKKGMWMGGNLPLGYDSPDRKLIVNRAEAEMVRQIFRRYVELRSVRDLKAELDAGGIVSKVRVSKTGRTSGGKPFTRGALYHLLQNRVYIGEITHKDESYPGQHEAIIDRELWDEVQATLELNRVDRKLGVNAKNPSLLTGILFDEKGNRLMPSHAAGKGGRRYRYYIKCTYRRLAAYPAAGQGNRKRRAGRTKTISVPSRCETERRRMPRPSPDGRAPRDLDSGTDRNRFGRSGASDCAHLAQASRRRDQVDLGSRCLFAATVAGPRADQGRCESILLERLSYGFSGFSGKNGPLHTMSRWRAVAVVGL